MSSEFWTITYVYSVRWRRMSVKQRAGLENNGIRPGISSGYLGIPQKISLRAQNPLKHPYIHKLRKRRFKIKRIQNVINELINMFYMMQHGRSVLLLGGYRLQRPNIVKVTDFLYGKTLRFRICILPSQPKQVNIYTLFSGSHYDT